MPGLIPSNLYSYVVLWTPVLSHFLTWFSAVILELLSTVLPSADFSTLGLETSFKSYHQPPFPPHALLFEH